MNVRLALRGDLRGHDADRLALVGHGDALPDDAVQVRVLLVQVDVEMELEGGGGSGSRQGVARGHRIVQGIERRIKAAMVLLVRLGDQRRDRVKGGEDRDLLPVGVDHQYFVEEAEALQRRLEPRRAARGAERRGVDALHVLSECVVDGRYRIDRTRHDRLPLQLTRGPGYVPARAVGAAVARPSPARDQVRREMTDHALVELELRPCLPAGL